RDGFERLYNRTGRISLLDRDALHRDAGAIAVKDFLHPLLNAAFDKVYAEYKLAPEVTRRRMYYETMERVLAKTDKTIVEAPNVVPYVPLPPQPPRAQGAAQ
ncbi:MAG: hypothetical protein ABW128_03325, partial [Rhizorhabdus sp.]